jgi:hypothetical protein
MIGFPGIERIELEKAKLSIQTRVQSIADSPLGEEQKTELKKDLARVAQRPNLAAETMFRVTFLQAMLFPDQFDDFVSINRSQYTDDYFACLEFVRHNLRTRFNKYMESCNNLPEPKLRESCIGKDEYFPTLNYLDSIEMVVRGKAPWAQTPSGVVILIAKKMIGEEKYTQLIKSGQKSAQKAYDEILSCS